MKFEAFSKPYQQNPEASKKTKKQISKQQWHQPSKLSNTKWLTNISSNFQSTDFWFYHFLLVSDEQQIWWKSLFNLLPNTIHQSQILRMRAKNSICI